MYKVGTKTLINIHLNDGNHIVISVDTLCLAFTLAIAHKGQQVANIKILRARDKYMSLKGANSLLHSLEEASDLEIRDILEGIL